MKEVGVVDTIQGKHAKVIIQRNAACGDCGACHIGTENMTMEADALNLINAKKGDSVEVELAFVNVFKAAVILYGIPLLMFIFGSVLGFFISGTIGFESNSPIVAFIIGFVLMGIAYGIIKYFDKKGTFKFKYQPQITGYYEGVLPKYIKSSSDDNIKEK
jgi:sigma-E factor negative regulatory protein RseC